MTPDVGQLINGRYRLLRLVGDGGMGTVYEARHQLLGTSVALKFLHPHLARKSEVVERFLQEAQVAARIHNPHVVRATDVDRTEDGTAFMVMEFVNGDTLLEHYERLRNEDVWLERSIAFEYILQIFEGVEAAHARGVVHRDLKPDNVMLEPVDEEGVILRILDFGLAKLKVDSGLGPSLTQPGMVMGTPEYMAPEQALAPSTVDARADVFSLGVMLYEMIAGDLPVHGPMLAIVDAYKNGRYARLDQVADVSPDLAAAVQCAMACPIEERFATVSAFREAIAPFLSQRTISALPPSVSVNPKAQSQSSEAPAPAWRNAMPSEPDTARERVGGGPPTTVPEEPEPPVARTRFSEPVVAKLDEAPPPAANLQPPPRAADLEPPPQPAVLELGPELVEGPPAAPSAQGGARWWMLAGGMLLLAGLIGAGVVYREPLLQAFAPDVSTGSDDGGQPTPKPQETVEPPTSSTSPPVAKPPTQPTMPVAEGTWDDRLVRIRHAARRDGNNQTLEVQIEDGGTPLTLRRVRAVLEYYVDHRRVIHDRTDLDTQAYRFVIELPRNGEYHARIQAETDAGTVWFTCDICVGGIQRLCPNMAPRCSPNAEPPNHRH